jgi:hypothetical protein
MADTKITALAAITTVDPAADVLPIVDISDTSMAASGTTKKITSNQILGAGGTATLASATITGAATVGTTLGVTGVSTLAADLILGQSSSALQSGGRGITIFGTSASEIKFLNSTTGSSATDGTALVTGSNNFTINNREVGTVVIGTSNTQRLVIEAAGDVTVSTGNVVMATSGKGIDFSATASGSGTMTSELLNDYEEGTFVPVVADAATGGNTGTCVINHAIYTKIGRQVTVRFYLSSINTTGMTAGNTLFIRGFPFAAVRGGNGNFYTYRVGRNASTVSSSANISETASHIVFGCYASSSATGDIFILVSDIVSGTSEIIATVTYTA